MAQWILIAEASSPSKLEQVTPTVTNIPVNTPTKIEIKTPWYFPIAPIADFWGAEWWASKLVSAGIHVDDVYGEGLHKIVIEGTTTQQVTATGETVFPQLAWYWWLGIIATAIASIDLIIDLIRVWIYTAREVIETITDLLPILMPMLMIFLMVTLMMNISSIFPSVEEPKKLPPPPTILKIEGPGE